MTEQLDDWRTALLTARSIFGHIIVDPKLSKSAPAKRWAERGGAVVDQALARWANEP